MMYLRAFAAEMQEIIRELEASSAVVSAGGGAAQGLQPAGGVLLGTSSAASQAATAARRIRPIRTTANALAAEMRGLIQTPTFRYGERTSPASMMTNFRGAIARMERSHGSIMSQQVNASVGGTVRIVSKQFTRDKQKQSNFRTISSVFQQYVEVWQLMTHFSSPFNRLCR